MLFETAPSFLLCQNLITIRRIVGERNVYNLNSRFQPYGDFVDVCDICSANEPSAEVKYSYLLHIFSRRIDGGDSVVHRNDYIDIIAFRILRTGCRAIADKSETTYRCGDFWDYDFLIKSVSYTGLIVDKRIFIARERIRCAEGETDGISLVKEYAERNPVAHRSGPD